MAQPMNIFSYYAAYKLTVESQAKIRVEVANKKALAN